MRGRLAHLRTGPAMATLLACLGAGLSMPARAQDRPPVAYGAFGAAPSTRAGTATAPSYGWPSHPQVPAQIYPANPYFPTPAPRSPADRRGIAFPLQWYASHARAGPAPPLRPGIASPFAGPYAASRHASGHPHRTHDLRVGRLDMLVTQTDLRCHYHLRSARGLPFHRQVRCDHTHGHRPDVRYTGGL